LKKLLYIAFFFSFLSCSKNHDEAAQCAISGVIEAGENPQHIFIYKFNGESMEEVKSAEVLLTFGSNTVLLEYRNNLGYGYFQSPLQVQQGMVYTLSAKIDGQTLRASARVPGAPALLQTSPSNFSIDINNPSGQVYSCNWGGADSLSYLLQLRLVEASPVLIPFVSGGNGFADSFSGPYDSNGLALVGNDFGYYGNHKLSIISINPDYRNVLFKQSTDDRNFLLNGPDNVEGGLGFFTAVNRTQIDLEVNP
jgi:hypothetical protein